MKLYVWNQPYGVRYGGSILYAVAASEEKARALAKTALVSQYGYSPDQRVSLDDPLGAPDRVCDLPYAEYYEWSE